MDHWLTSIGLLDPTAAKTLMNIFGLTPPQLQLVLAWRYKFLLAFAAPELCSQFNVSTIDDLFWLQWSVLCPRRARDIDLKPKILWWSWCAC